jgi:peptidoglycan/LPS O-acetylase OafA/YrhL
MLRDRFDPRRNNFDLIRLLAALVVAFAHTYSLNGRADPLTGLLAYDYCGTMAVWVFLVISGFLVARSIEHQTTTNFVIARFLRIYPAFALAIGIQSFVIIPAFYELPISDYIGNGLLLSLDNLLLWPQNLAIPHVFSHLAAPVVNGSLWTIPLEVSFYMILVIASGTFMSVQALYPVVFFGLVAGTIALRYLGIGFFSDQPSVFDGVTVYSFVVYSTYFWAGVCAWKYRDRINMSLGGFVIALLMLFAARHTAISQVAMIVLLPYIVLYLCVAGSIGTILHRWVGDLSYGVYLFAFPITNSVISLTGGKLHPHVVFIISMTIFTTISYASWHLLEKRMLALKPRSRPQLEPIAGSASVAPFKRFAS